MEESQLKMGADQVRAVIGRHMLADGMDLVLDLEKSHGSYLYDARRGEYFLDFFSFYVTNPVGFNHPRLVSPETRSELGRLAAHKPSNSDVYTVEMAEFVETFSRLARPDFMRYFFFVEGGALAVENALKVAFDWKVRKNLAAGRGELGLQVLHFRQAFHGRSGYTLSLTNTADPRKTQYFPRFDWPRVRNPKCTFPLEGENLAATVRAEEEALAQIEEALALHPHEIACLILEPIQAEGGDNFFRPEFHRRLRQLCDEHDMLMIYDEVQTGFGLTGRMWAYEHYVEPDIIAFGKKTQVCGIMVNERVDEVPDNVFHESSRINSTWGGNLIDMVRCRIYLEIYQEEKLVERARTSGEFLLGELQVLAGEFPALVSNPRGLGLLCAFDLPDAQTRERLLARLFERRLIILPCGERSIRFRPSLNIPREDLEKGLTLLRQTLPHL